jgi:hypothetical protein
MMRGVGSSYDNSCLFVIESSFQRAAQVCRGILATERSRPPSPAFLSISLGGPFDQGCDVLWM